eukprot:1325418-Amphidinium_carterae.1
MSHGPWTASSCARNKSVRLAVSMAKAVEAPVGADIEQADEGVNTQHERSPSVRHVACWLLHNAVLLILGGLIGVVYCGLDLKSYRAVRPSESAEPVDLVRVYTSAAGTVQLYLDVTFPRVTCDKLELDLVSVTGLIQLHMEDSMAKVELDANGAHTDGARCMDDAAGLGCPFGCRLTGAAM